MNKSNYKEWSVDFNGKTIKVSNWWNWKMKGSADLYLDDEHLDKNTDMMANPKKAILSKYEVSDEIKSIEVFAAGTFKIKISIKTIVYMSPVHLPVHQIRRLGIIFLQFVHSTLKKKE